MARIRKQPASMNAAPRVGQAQSIIHTRSGPTRMFSGLKSVCNSASPSSTSRSASQSTYASLPNHPGVIHAQALDEHRARVGVQDHGELRAQARAGGTRSVYPARACLDREAHRLLELIPVGMAHAPPSEGPRTQPGKAEPA